METFVQDLRYAVRLLIKSPAFTIAVVLTLGLGIGANALMFGVVDRLMFRPHAYLRDPGTVQRVYLQWQDRGRARTSAVLQYSRFADLKRWTGSFSQSAGFASRTVAVGSGEAVRERSIAAVSASFFEFFDAPPALGRYFLAAEDTTPRGAAVAVLGYSYWKTEFAGRDVRGEKLQVGSTLCDIIGVAPRGFVGVDENQPADVYIPITTYAGANPGSSGRNYYLNYNWGWMEVMVRRAPGVSVAAADADLSTAYWKSWKAEEAIARGVTPAEVARPSAMVSALKQGAGPDPGLEARTALWVTGVAAVVLIIACANVANLLLARAIGRRRDTALRLALGISRRRAITQVLMESVLLAALGSIAGLVIAVWGGAVVTTLFVPDGSAVSVVDSRVLGVALVLTVVTGLVTGLVPALASRDSNVSGALKAGVREGTHWRSRTRSVLLVIQGALSVVLLIGAGLFVRSLDEVRGMRLGYDMDPVLLASRNLRGVRLGDSLENANGRAMLAAAQAIPGVEHAAWVGTVPFYSTSGTDLYVAGIDSVRRLGQFTFQVATPDFFATVGTRILRGRPFTEADRHGSPLVAVVSENMARTLWPGREALGQCMRLESATAPCTTIIGIAENARQSSLTSDQMLQYYMPIDQYGSQEGFAVMLRMQGNPDASIEPVRRAIQRIMPGQAYVSVQPMRQIINAERRSWEVGTTMFVAFGALALVVAAIGLYSVISYNVAQRTNELGVRVALGARAGDVIRLVVGQGTGFALWGVALGCALALGAGRWVQPLLFQESARDPLVFGFVAVVLLAVAGLASYLPARRAARVDPMVALRSE